MQTFLKEVIKWKKIELLIDSKIFNKNIVLKTAFSFLDKWYFFFKLDKDNNLILQFTIKDWIKDKWEDVLWDFSDNLLETVLRDKLEKSNKKIRESIVLKAIWSSLDTKNFVSLDTDKETKENNEDKIDFDKDIDEILEEIENDPELKIDKKEIDKILKEIEKEEIEENRK